ncbi:hypothetical protein GGR51DRAFT_516819 [Nemania sp. FL0031]|nr:hypothetical protein GGR51DRAFT_516819 [Nemania sp. FL0031]
MSTPGTPLSSVHSAALNSAAMMPDSTPTIQRLFDSEAGNTNCGSDHSTPIKPLDLLSQGSDGNTVNHDQENVSPSKSRHSRVLSGNGLSPLKILASQDLLGSEPRSPDRTAAVKSPRKWCPDKRFPVKVNSATSPERNSSASPERPAVQHREITLQDAMAENKDLARAIDIFEDEDTMMENAGDEGNDTFMSMGQEQGHEDQMENDEEQAGPDDTMISTFSTFSAVPNLTMFASIGHTPTKFANVGATPTTRSRMDLLSDRTPRATMRRESTNLLDFTEQIQSFSSRYVEQMSNLRRGSPNKSSGSTITVTPKKRQTNLLDFDIPPLPTPRSIPTITPRELESLKSGFLSEISSLKASLSGKEAEVLSLKTAVADAEKRVGECMEELREVKAVKETLVEQQESWEKRGRDMESVLRKVKEEIVRSQCEREQLESKLEESEKRREAAEIMAQEAESKMAAMRAGKANADAPTDGSGSKSPEKNKMPGSREVEIAVEKVSRELHALYKSKHETKITALKKSYENRWSKKVHELEAKIEELAEDNEKLRVGRDATMTKVDPNQSIIDDERKAQAVKDSTQIRELNAEIQKLGAVVASVKSDNQELRMLLEKERVEKGELVQLAEEMMSMQSICQTEAPRPAPPAVKPQPATNDQFRASVGRGSGLRAPGSVKKPAESRIGGLGNERKIGGLPRPGSGTGSRSGIMSSIEKMGNYRGRGE